jgi:serine protease Do
VSGGPTLDAHGQVIGINVAARRDGEQVSFLVPAGFGEDLLAQPRESVIPITEPAYPELTRQLTAHQEVLTERFLAQAWRNAGHARYRIPVPPEAFMRCWGQSNPVESKGWEFSRSECQMDGRIFVSGSLTTGWLNVRHEAYDGRKLGVLRFAKQYSDSFQNEAFGGGSAQRTPPQCHERYVDREGLPMRAVICLTAYRKLPELYDASVLVATLDASKQGVQGRFDARGVTFENALKLSAHYLDGFGRPAPAGDAR